MDEANAIAANPVQDPVDGECSLLLYLTLPGNIVWDKDLLLANADEDSSANTAKPRIMLLAAASAFAPANSDGIDNDAG